ncbi:Integration host factor subunit beta [Thiomonas sp. X19]|uniref:HU family DNA-binding protein n=1 Tax=Thiomonas sp. X19 TaxID=1050370 RepID=UPI000B6D9812|nr:HU family DNA-binding protein [Thiomonas sp. X19]SCC93588.1 Integration host factor subunit beta [Thiomonas sp. X19]SCC94701.1 Integration host factor subunit beta [Thiomonas sp. X19]
MLRSELIDRLAERHPHLARKDAEQSVEVILDAIMQAVAEGKRVEIRNFGAFSASERRARMVRNPRSGETFMAPAMRSPRFRAGKPLQALDPMQAGQAIALASIDSLPQQ